MSNQQTKSPANEVTPEQPKVVLESVDNEDDFGAAPAENIDTPVVQVQEVETVPLAEGQEQVAEDSGEESEQQVYEQTVEEQAEDQAEDQLDIGIKQPTFDGSVETENEIDNGPEMQDSTLIQDQLSYLTGSDDILGEKSVGMSSDNFACTQNDFTDTASVIGLVLNLAAAGIVVNGVNGGEDLSDIYLNDNNSPASVASVQLLATLPKKAPKAVGWDGALPLILETLFEQTRTNNGWVVRAYVAPESKKLKSILNGSLPKAIDSGELVDLVTHLKDKGLESVAGHSIIIRIANTSHDLLKFYPAFDGQTPNFQIVDGSLELFTPSLVGMVRLVKYLSAKGVTVASDPHAIYRNWVADVVELQVFVEETESDEDEQYEQLTENLVLYPRYEQYGLLLKIPSNAKLEEVLDPFLWQEQLLDAVNTASTGKDSESKLSRYQVASVGENNNSGYHSEILLGAEKLVHAAIILRQSTEIILEDEVEDEEIEDAED